MKEKDFMTSVLNGSGVTQIYEYLTKRLKHEGYLVGDSEENLKEYKLSKRGFAMHQLSHEEDSPIKMNRKLLRGILEADTENKSQLVRLLGVEATELTSNTTNFTIRYEFYNKK